jgi:outer membrane protein assembly factor BamB
MKYRALGTLVLLAACGRSGRHAQPTGPLLAAPTVAALPPPVADAGPPDSPEGEDVLADVLERNGDKYAPPPTKFRPGHVTPKRVDPALVHAAGKGFRVRFPSGAPVATPAAYHGRVFVSGGFRSKDFYAFDAQTGAPAWALALDDDGPSNPACEDGSCVFNTESCTLFSVDAQSGALRWSWWLGDPLTSSPAIADGRVFTSYPVAQSAQSAKPRPPDTTHAIAAFDLRTGRLLWTRWLDSDVMSAPVATGGELLATTFAGTLIRFDAATGEIRSARRARATSAPVVAADHSVYYAQRADAPAAGASASATPASEQVVKQSTKSGWTANKKAAPYLDSNVQSGSMYHASGTANDTANGFGGGAPTAANPSAALKNIGQGGVATMQAFQGSRPLAMGDRIYSSMGDEIVANETTTGQKLWSHKLPGDVARAGGFLAAPPSAAGGRLIVSTLAGQVLVIDSASGAVAAQYDLGGAARSQAAVQDGWIYVGTEDGHLVAIDTGDRSLTGWPMWGGNAARTGTP